MSNTEQLTQALNQHFADQILELSEAHGEITMEIDAKDLLAVAKTLRDEEPFQFQQLIDLCGVDYKEYSTSEWSTNNATATGFERGVRKQKKIQVKPFTKPRFAVTYHLLSMNLNQRLRLKVFLEQDPPVINSVIQLWPCADWFEREAFDLYGILFSGHPDLRRILTDYGFIGHPFRKDFPLIGQVEMRYDASQKRVIYEPVSIQPRTLVPKVIRQDHRYCEEPQVEGEDHG